MHPRSLDLGGYRFLCRFSGTPQPERVPIFFVSGAFQNMASWKRFEDRFAPHRATLFADLPGTGAADVLSADKGLDFLADAVRLALDTAGAERAHIVSASYGTPIAYELARRHPERVACLVLAGTMCSVPDRLRVRIARSIEFARAHRTAEFVAEVVDGMLCRDPSVTIHRGRLAQRILTAGLVHMPDHARAQFVANSTRLLRHEALDLSSPPDARTLVFTGEHDVFTSPGDCRKMAHAIPGAAFATIRDTDHLFHLERPETTVELVARFVEGGDLESIDHVDLIDAPEPRALSSLAPAKPAAVA